MVSSCIDSLGAMLLERLLDPPAPVEPFVRASFDQAVRVEQEDVTGSQRKVGLLEVLVLERAEDRALDRSPARPRFGLRAGTSIGGGCPPRAIVNFIDLGSSTP